MPKKKTTTQAVESKVLTIGVPPISLRNATKDQLQQYSAYLEQLLVTPGWNVLETMLKENMELLREQIVTKVNTGGELMDERAIDELRIQYSQIKQLLDKPRQLINQFTKPPKGVDQMPEYDVYSGTGKPAMTMGDTT